MTKRRNIADLPRTVEGVVETMVCFVRVYLTAGRYVVPTGVHVTVRTSNVPACLS